MDSRFAILALLIDSSVQFLENMGFVETRAERVRGPKA